MNTLNTVENLLQRYFAAGYSSDGENALGTLFEIIRTRMNTNCKDKTNQKIIFNILDRLMDHCSLRLSSVISFIEQKMEVFLEIGRNEQHSADSKLWNIIASFGMSRFIFKNFDPMCDLLILPNTDIQP